jgi:hypothetical protein
MTLTLNAKYPEKQASLNLIYYKCDLSLLKSSTKQKDCLEKKLKEVIENQEDVIQKSYFVAIGYPKLGSLDELVDIIERDNRQTFSSSRSLDEEIKKAIAKREEEQRSGSASVK